MSLLKLDRDMRQQNVSCHAMFLVGEKTLNTTGFLITLRTYVTTPAKIPGVHATHKYCCSHMKGAIQVLRNGGGEGVSNFLEQSVTKV